MDEMKCFKCQITKPFSEFPKNKTKKYGIHGNCFDCQRAYMKAHYKKHETEYKERTGKRRKMDRAEFIKFVKNLKNVPCSDCGKKFHHCAMDFDHVNGQKKFCISTRGNQKINQSILDEIAKCEIVCACCHRVRTYNRINNVPLV